MYPDYMSAVASRSDADDHGRIASRLRVPWSCAGRWPWPPAQQRLEVLPAQGNVFVIVGPRRQHHRADRPRGPLVVDTQPAALSERCSTAIRVLTPHPIRHIVLTSGDDQAAGGAGSLSKAGRYVRVIDSIDPRGFDTRASIIAHLNVLNRMNADEGAVRHRGRPTPISRRVVAVLERRGRAASSTCRPAHTDGDTIVFFRRSDVISTGAIFDTTAYPRFDPERGGSIAGVIEGLNRVIDIAVAGENQEGGTVIVPGRGRLSDETDVANYRDMVDDRPRPRARSRQEGPIARTGEAREADARLRRPLRRTDRRWTASCSSRRSTAT